MSSLQVLRAGPLTTVQDAGRPGFAHVGVSPSGALDRPAYEIANRLVGNPAGAAALEATVVGPTLILRGACLHHIALTGAPAPLWVDGIARALYEPVPVLPGQRIDVGAAVSGMRSYLAISGGIDGESVLGSLSTDLLSGLGPPVLSDGSVLALGKPGPAGVLVATPTASEVTVPTRLQVSLGPRLDWLDAASAERLQSASWIVSADSNRVGLRLTGPALRWSSHLQLPSEGIVSGSIQVPPDGQPVLFLQDHPVTGGYPVVAVLTDRSLPAAAQLRPGSSIKLWAR